MSIGYFSLHVFHLESSTPPRVFVDVVWLYSTRDLSLDLKFRDWQRWIRTCTWTFFDVALDVSSQERFTAFYNQIPGVGQKKKGPLEEQWEFFEGFHRCQAWHKHLGKYWLSTETIHLCTEWHHHAGSFYEAFLLWLTIYRLITPHSSYTIVTDGSYNITNLTH